MSIVPKLILKCMVSRVIDGDTVEVLLCRKIKVRLLDVNAQELHTVVGQQLKDYVSSILPPNTEVILEVPLNGDDLLDINSFNRVLGTLYHQDININQQINKQIDQS